MNGLYKSSPILAEANGSRLSEPEGKAPIPPHSAGGGKTKGRPPNGKHSPRASPRFHRRVSASRKNDFGSDLRRLSSASVTSRRASSKRRQQSLQKQLELSMKKKKRQLTGGKESKPPKTLLSRMLKSNGHKSKPAANQNKAKRVRSDDNRGGNNSSPGHHRQSLLMRVHTRLFSKRKKLRSIYDLPDLSNLADCNFTKEYETPRECFHRFEKTPLIGELFFLSLFLSTNIFHVFYRIPERCEMKSIGSTFKLLVKYLCKKCCNKCSSFRGGLEQCWH